MQVSKILKPVCGVIALALDYCLTPDLYHSYLSASI
jgi:hypothetical protein